MLGTNAWWLSYLTSNADVDTVMSEIANVNFPLKPLNTIWITERPRNRANSKSSESGHSALSMLFPKRAPSTFRFSTRQAPTLTTAHTGLNVSMPSSRARKPTVSALSYLSPTTGVISVVSPRTIPHSATTPHHGTRPHHHKPPIDHTSRRSSTATRIPPPSSPGSSATSRAARAAPPPSSPTGPPTPAPISSPSTARTW